MNVFVMRSASLQLYTVQRCGAAVTVLRLEPWDPPARPNTPPALSSLSKSNQFYWIYRTFWASCRLKHILDLTKKF